MVRWRAQRRSWNYEIEKIGSKRVRHSLRALQNRRQRIMERWMRREVTGSDCMHQPGRWEIRNARRTETTQTGNTMRRLVGAAYGSQDKETPQNLSMTSTVRQRRTGQDRNDGTFDASAGGKQTRLGLATAGLLQRVWSALNAQQKTPHLLAVDALWTGATHQIFFFLRK